MCVCVCVSSTQAAHPQTTPRLGTGNSRYKMRTCSRGLRAGLRPLSPRPVTRRFTLLDHSRDTGFVSSSLVDTLSHGIASSVKCSSECHNIFVRHSDLVGGRGDRVSLILTGQMLPCCLLNVGSRSFMPLKKKEISAK